MFKKKLIFLLNTTSIIASAGITSCTPILGGEYSNFNIGLHPQYLTNNLITNFNFEGFEADNTNGMINFLPRRKKATDVLLFADGNKPIRMNVQSTTNSPLNERKKISFNELHRIQRLQNHLYRFSNNSINSYHKFAQQVLGVNSPGYYRNSKDIIADFNNVELRDGVKAQLEIKEVFDKAGKNSQNIVNMYNYFSRFYGKENMKRWLFSLTIHDKFHGADPNILGGTSLYGGLGAQFISLRNEGFDSKSIENNFNFGWFTSNNSASTFVHEYGHALENALMYLPGQLNTNYLPSHKLLASVGEKVSTFLSPWADKEINQDVNFGQYKVFPQMPTKLKASEEFVKFIATKLGFDKSQINLEKDVKSPQHYSFINSNEATITSYIVAQLFVDGNYGKTMLMEQFAEMFAYWLWKPTVQSDSSKYSIRWTIINEFFLEYLPKAYQAEIK